ncbi:MAG: host attachment protein [Alphaproteobacteria bacterium]|nr:host attachment protein [Alphaproteobacteria bacterium]MBF0251294.1 host attachment protein [Alphaproteobacteria bacterium]
MKPRITWILVADGARARIVRNEGPGKGLSAALDYEFAASHAPTRDFGADKPGRSQGGGGASHAKAGKVDWHTFEKQLFAQEMVKVLDDAHGKGAFDSLVLVAPPKTLGELRKGMNGKLSEVVRAEVGKDLTHLNLHDLAEHLADAILL